MEHNFDHPVSSSTHWIFNVQQTSKLRGLEPCLGTLNTSLKLTGKLMKEVQNRVPGRP